MGATSRDARPGVENLDTQSDSSGALDTNQATAAFLDLLSPPEPDKAEPVEASQPEPEPPVEASAEDKPEAEDEAQTDDDPTVTVKVDGKDIEVKLSDLKRGYQKDAAANQRFEQAAELRKQAEAETQKAQQERQAYAQRLQMLHAQASQALEQQKQIDWEALKSSDPVEFVNQVRLANERQAIQAQTQTEMQRLQALQAHEQEAQLTRHLTDEAKRLADAIPEWKDPKKAQSGQMEVFDHLVKVMGYRPEDVTLQRDASGRITNPGITDHRLVVLARESMLYRQLMAKAETTQKRVANLPQKVEKPGNGENQTLDRRSSAFQRLSKSGKAEDAAAVFASIL